MFGLCLVGYSGQVDPNQTSILSVYDIKMSFFKHPVAELGFNFELEFLKLFKDKTKTNM